MRIIRSGWTGDERFRGSYSFVPVTAAMQRGAPNQDLSSSSSSLPSSTSTSSALKVFDALARPLTFADAAPPPAADGCGGGYNADANGDSSSRQRGALLSPAPRLLFAGEHTHKTRYGTMDGAASTGRREAMRLLGLYGDH